MSASVNGPTNKVLTFLALFRPESLFSPSKYGPMINNFFPSALADKISDFF